MVSKNVDSKTSSSNLSRSRKSQSTETTSKSKPKTPAVQTVGQNDTSTDSDSNSSSSSSESPQIQETRSPVAGDAYASDEAFFGPWELSLKLDLIAVSLFVLAAATRFHNLTHPHSIVFDELHYGKYASLYVRRIFFFDPHPPLGKQLIAGASWLFDSAYNGTFKFDRIGAPYPEWVPVFGLRFVPALAGSCLPSLIYLFCREMKISVGLSFLAGILIIFDNALLIQSRYILMEMPMILFGMLSLYFALNFTKQPGVPKFKAFGMASISAFFGTLSMSIKYLGGFYLLLSSIIIFYHLWTHLVPQKQLRDSTILKILAATWILFWSTFALTYLSIFYVHLSVLTNAGPHDAVMTSAFQASLKGGLASIIKGQPLEVVHGSQVTLRHSLGRPCWLHSHAQNYPVKYTDGRGSSHQQQVTCYAFKDVNNWWIIKRPNISNLSVNETKDYIRHGDEIHLVHGMTGRLLNSHDVAAPMTPQNQEVSCYIDHNVSMAAEPLWRVEVIGDCSGGGDGNNCLWHAVKSMVRLVHISTGQALKMTGKQLPKWGFNQHEVTTDRVVVQDDTTWNVEEHRYTKSEKDREKELLEAEMIPTSPTLLSFWSKFLELQWKMLSSSSNSAQNDAHAYSSYPTEWFLLSRGIAYWISGTPNSNAQIYLLGNPLLWLSGSFGLFLCSGIVMIYASVRRRKVPILRDEAWGKLLFQVGIVMGGYGLTYVYHFCVDRTLFLHHYLPSYVFQILVLIVTLDHLRTIAGQSKYTKASFLLVLFLWSLGILYGFKTFCPVSYGDPPLSRPELESLKWMNSWDFIIQG